MDMPARYAAFDIFVLPSISEAMPMALLEAMAAGKPGVATAVGSVPSVVENGKTAILVAPGNPSSLAAGICGLLGNDGVRRAMGRAAQRTVLARYSASEMARRYLAIYEFLAVRNELARVSVN
jgi:glycosyltransferase involved in cell wall biosynthesis